MACTVITTKKAEKNLMKLPKAVAQAYDLLVSDLQETGAIQKSWKNFSALGNDRYHCHLSYKWVACWQRIRGTIYIEVYYVGSRENAPY